MDSIERQLEQIKKQLDSMSLSIDKRLGKIESHLYNDDETETDGIVKRVRDHGHRLEKLEEKDRKRDWMLAKWGSFGGGLLIGVVELFKYLLSK